MKKYALLVMFGAALAMTSCGGEETTTEETNAPAETEGGNTLMNNLIEEGVEHAVEEVTEQLADSSSMLNEAFDTLKGVINENEEVIEDAVEDAVQEGLNKLN